MTQIAARRAGGMMIRLWAAFREAFDRTSGRTKRRADTERAYAACVNCLATMMRADAERLMREQLAARIKADTSALATRVH